MQTDRRTLALIPARGGSKGLPRKNLLPLNGKPLIAWTIEQALASRHVDRVVVTTDDEEIAEVSRAFGADVPFLRPPELALDSSPSIDAADHAIAWLRVNDGQEFDYTALLEPTSPLRAPGDIDAAIELLAASEDRADGVVSVGEVHMEHPAIVKRIDESGLLRSYLEDDRKVTRRQDLGTAYFPYGVVYLVRTLRMIEDRTFYPDRTLPLLLERWQNYEIDDILDFVCVEAVMNHRMAKDA